MLNNKLFIAISLLIAVVDSLFIAGNYYFSRQSLEEEFSTQARIFSSSFQAAQKTAENNLMMIASVFAADQKVQKLFAEGKKAVAEEGGGAGGEKAAAIRQKLYDLVWPRWKDATERLGARQLHFHLGPGSLSFLRVHRPEKFGDRMDNVRFTIVDTNAQRTPRTGFETGRVYAGIRGVVSVDMESPETGEIEHVGVLEAGISYQSLVNSLKQSTGTDVSILLTRKHIESAMWPTFIKERFNQFTPCGCVIESTSSPLPEGILTRAKRDADGKFIKDGLSQFMIDGNRHLVAAFFPLRDYLGMKDRSRDDVGVIVIWQDVTARMAAFQKTQWFNLGYGLLAYLFVELLFYFGFKWASRSLQHEIKSSAEALAESKSQQNLLEYALDNIEEEVFLIDEQAVFHYTNKNALKKLGYESEGLVGKRVSDVDTDYSADAWPGHWQDVRRQKSVTFETRHQTREGEIYLAEVNSNFIEFNQTNYILALVRDITERKQHQLEIEKSNQRYRSVIETAWDGFWMVDNEGHIQEVNDAYCTMSGYSREEITGLPIQNFEAAETAAETAGHIETIVRNGSDMFETTHYRKDGSLLPLEVTVSYTTDNGGTFFSFLRDIRKRKLEEKIGEIHEKLSHAIYDEDLGLDGLLQIALDAAEQITNSQIGFMHFVAEDQETIYLQTWSTRTLREMCFAKGEGMHYPVSEAGVWVDCIHQRQPVIHNDYAALPHKKGLPEGHAELLRELTVPVMRDNKIVAVLGVGNKQSDYDELDVDVVTKIGNIIYDFAEHAKTKKRVEYMAYFDTLTGLPNRDLLFDRLNQGIAQHKRSGKLLAVCYLDLDGFKPVNDKYGHETGDKLLISLGERLNELLREGDTLSRIGGDEFGILLTALETPHESEAIVQRILSAINVPFDIDEQRLYVSGTIGITVFPTDNNTAEVLLRHADQAMYQAKEQGKGRYNLYEVISEDKLRTHRETIEGIYHGLDSQEFVLYYQPRVDLNNGNVVGMEALVRWRHPHRGLLAPAAFLPFIEGTPVEIALGEWVVKTAVSQLYEWQTAGLDLPVSINISPDHIQQQEFAGFLKNVLSDYPPSVSKSVELEVLETSSIGDVEEVASVMNECEKLGVSFSLDDFGTGYSSLTYFHHLPISILKIDQNFVRSMLDNANDLDIVEGVIRLSQALKRPVVAEGVETVELGLLLMYLGCHYAQGYGIARPMPAEVVPSWLEEWQDNSEWHELAKIKIPNEEDVELKVAVFSHLRWKQKIENYVNSSGQSELPVMESDGCQFNHWYHGIGKTRYGLKPVYPFIMPKHIHVHAVGQKLVALVDDNKRDEAKSHLSALEAACQELIDMLHQLQTN